MDSRIIKILIVSLLVLFFAFPSRAANSLDVVINEIAWMGTKIDEVEPKNWWRYEWLELYNNTNRSISLDGWKIELYRTDLDWSLKLKGIILAQDYFLIVASDKIFSNYDLNYSNLGGKFINSGQKVLLKDALGNVIDEVDCFSYGKWFAGNNQTKQTMERINSLLASKAENWKDSRNSGGTPGGKNSVTVGLESEIKREFDPEQKILNKPEIDQELKTCPLSEFRAPTVETPNCRNPDLRQSEPRPPKVKNYPSGIVFNEIFPSPIGPDEKEEWIEIFNQNNFEVDLSGWQIADSKGKTKIYTFPKGTIVGPKGFLVLSRQTTKITLNNSGDSLKLLWPNGKIIDSLSYKKAQRGQSYNRTKSKWIWSSILTPGSANITPSLFSKLEENKNPTIVATTVKEEPKKTLTSDKEKLAVISEQISNNSSFSFLFIFLIALAVAFFSGIAILILKKRLKLS